MRGAVRWTIPGLTSSRQVTVRNRIPADDAATSGRGWDRLAWVGTERASLDLGRPRSRSAPMVERRLPMRVVDRTIRSLLSRSVHLAGSPAGSVRPAIRTPVPALPATRVAHATTRKSARLARPGRAGSAWLADRSLATLVRRVIPAPEIANQSPAVRVGPVTPTRKHANQRLVLNARLM